MGRPPVFWANVGVKAALVGLLAFGAFSGLEQFEGKAFGWRLLTYPLSAVLVPLVWQLRGRPQPYPYALDILLVSPFLVDVLGNTFDLYDTVDWWDDANHFVNWGLLTAAFGQLLLRLRVGAWETFGLAIGFGATTAILWEVAEYVSFIRGSDELETAYTDTLGDMLLGLGGSVVAAALTVALLRRRDRAPT